MEQRSYYAIIPANVRYDETLPANAKLLYGEITALCNEKGYCWASNEYFAQLYKVSKISISKWIAALISRGYITSEIIYKEGTKQILNRYLRIATYPIKEKFNTPIKEKFNTPIKEKLKDNNTSFNNTNNNINNKDTIPYEKIKDLFHSLCPSYSKIIKLSDSRKKTIKARYIEYDKDISVFETLFRKAEESDFLKGNNDRGWKADFDWLLTPKYMPKVLEDGYANKGNKGAQSTKANQRTKETEKQEIIDRYNILR